jgi:lipopolysaccharide biosynthesis glycosyltransferase
MKNYNIMTSCDDNLADKVAVSITSVVKSLTGSHIDFYLLESNVSQKNIDMLNALYRKLNGETQIDFHDIKVSDSPIYSELAKYGGGWSKEAYYPLVAHLLLPKDVDKVIYIDAGDVIVIDDISAFYDYGFGGNSLLVTGARYIDLGDGIHFRVYTENDLCDHVNMLPEILRGVFNSGAYMINLDKMRNDERTLDDYLFLARALRDIVGGDNEQVYFGDQGLISTAFIGDMRYYPDGREYRNIFYMPYNFCLWYYDFCYLKVPYNTPIVHFTGSKFKPWFGEYPIHIARFQPDTSLLHSLNELQECQMEYYNMWFEYAKITDKILGEAGY